MRYHFCTGKRVDDLIPEHEVNVSGGNESGYIREEEIEVNKNDIDGEEWVI